MVVVSVYGDIPEAGDDDDCHEADEREARRNPPLAQAPEDLLNMRVIDVVVVRRPRGLLKSPS
jgi:hypothetical protein